MFSRKEWNIQRTIDNEDVLQGQGRLKLLSPHMYLWEETIETRTKDGQVLNGFQSYKVSRTGDKLDIFYNTGPDKNKLFQSFNLKQPRQVSHHICGNDTYVSHLEIVSRSEFTVTHTVKGPSKDYIMRSVYRYE